MAPMGVAKNSHADLTMRRRSDESRGEKRLATLLFVAPSVGSSLCRRLRPSCTRGGAGERERGTAFRATSSDSASRSGSETTDEAAVDVSLAVVVEEIDSSPELVDALESVEDIRV